ncbi:MAG: hypothetical protein K2I48_04400 [Muribaculaceae bacterium]|nr:hypothetical protein [Muribaculaceae bacterium]
MMKILRPVGQVMGLLLLAGAVMFDIFLLGATQVNRVIFVAVVVITTLAILGGCLAVAMRKGAKLRDIPWKQYAITFAVLMAGGALVPLAVNYFTVDYPDAPNEHGRVVKVYSQQRTRERRVGRRHVGGGETYTEYFARVSFDSGVEKDVNIPVATFVKTHKGDRATALSGIGAIGWRVMKPGSIEITHPRRSNRRNRLQTLPH